MKYLWEMMELLTVFVFTINLYALIVLLKLEDSIFLQLKHLIYSKINFYFLKIKYFVLICKAVVRLKQVRNIFLNNNKLKENLYQITKFNNNNNYNKNKKV